MSAPSSRQIFAFSGLPTVVATRAPRAVAIWMAVVPMPLPPPCTSSRSPAWRPPTITTFDHTVHVGLHQPAGLDEIDALGHRRDQTRRHGDQLGVPAAGEEGADLVADRERRHAVTQAATSPEHSSPRMSVAPGGGW